MVREFQGQWYETVYSLIEGLMSYAGSSNLFKSACNKDPWHPCSSHCSCASDGCIHENCEFSKCEGISVSVQGNLSMADQEERRRLGDGCLSLCFSSSVHTRQS